jgi:hypothetical protein
MKTILQLSLIIIADFCLGQNLNFDWATQSFGGEGSQSQSISVTTDNEGNIYSTGWFTGSIDFDPGPGVFNLTSSDNSDTYIMKSDQNGNLIWVRQVAGNEGEYNWEYSYSIATDNQGNVYITGQFFGTVDFDPGPDNFNLYCDNYTGSMFIQKLDFDGNFVWAKLICGDVESESKGKSIHLDNSGNILLTGYFFRTADFDPGPGVFNLTNLTSGQQGTGTTIFILKLTNNGDFIWAKQIESLDMEFGNDMGNAITSDFEGNILITGSFSRTLDFDPGPGVFQINIDYSVSDDYESIFLLKLDLGGNFIWAKHFESSMDSQGAEGRSLTTDQFGFVYSTGYFSGTTDFDPGPGIFQLTAPISRDNAYVSKLDINGNLVWVQHIGNMWGPGVTGNQIIVDDLGNIYTIGIFQGSVDFDPGTGNFVLSEGGTFIQKLDNNGGFIWAGELGGGLPSGCRDNAGNLILSGRFGGSIDVNPFTDQFILTSSSGLKSWILKLSNTSNSIVEQNSNGEKLLVKITNLLGQETEFKPNTVLIYVYSDGTTERIFKTE